jgi:xylulokinase
MTRVSGNVCVGIDIGTTSVKAVAADDDGNVVARARVPHRLLVPAADRLEHDAAQAWRRGPVRALRSLGLVADPLAVAVSAMVPSLTAVDRRGRPMAPGLLYGDARGRGDRQDRRGSDAGESLEFLRWLATTFPEAHGYWPAQAVANHALGGVASVDGATAFSMHPLYGLEGWDESVVKSAGAQVDQLPSVGNNGQPIGSVGSSILGASAIDAMGEQIVAGTDEPGDVLVICGTTLIVWVVVAEPVTVEGLWTIPSFTPGRFLVGGPSNAGGLFLNWASRLFGRPRPGAVASAGRVPVFSPYVRGERVPLHDPERRAAIDGLDLTHDASALRRAAYEASGFAARHIIDLAGISDGVRRIVATGGGTRDAEWMQALADATGADVDVVAVAEGGALGAAWFARMAAGLETAMHDAARWARTSHTVAPDPAWRAAMDDRYRRYVELAGRSRA